MKTFKVFLRGGSFYYTTVNDASTPETFLAYLRQAPLVTEDQVTGAEVFDYVERVEDVTAHTLKTKGV